MFHGSLSEGYFARISLNPIFTLTYDLIRIKIQAKILALVTGLNILSSMLLRGYLGATTYLFNEKKAFTT